MTRSGFWKATGIDKPIYSYVEGRTNQECIGLKKSLVYYRGSAGKGGSKTDWMMHEFRLPASKSTNLTNPKNSTQEAVRLVLKNHAVSLFLIQTLILYILICRKFGHFVGFLSDMFPTKSMTQNGKKTTLNEIWVIRARLHAVRSPTTLQTSMIQALELWLLRL